MDWEQIAQFLITSGIVAAVVGILAKLTTKWLGDKLGWDEAKKHKMSALLAEVAERAIRAAEQSAKHKKFNTSGEQALWKETYAIDMVTKLTGIDSDLAKSVLRAVFNASSFNTSAIVAHDGVHKFDDDEVSKKVAEILGDK